DVVSPFLSDASFDVIHLHWVNGGFFDIATLRHIKTPMVWLLHDSWAFTGGCHIPFDCVRYETGCYDCPELDERTRIDVARWVFQRKNQCYPKSMHIVAPSRWMADAAQSSALFSEYDIRVIPNGVDVQKYRPMNKCMARDILGVSQDCKLILFGAMSATSDWNKGFDLLFEALGRLRDNVNFAVQIVVFGSEKPSVPPDFGMPATYTGRLYDDVSLTLLYNAADVMVVPSRSENFPNVCLESMASGTPVVAFAIGGLLDQIKHKRNGYLARPYDVDDFANGIRWVLEDEERLRGLRYAARKRVETMFDLKAIVQRYNELYEEIISS
uniref:glycosyltransferase n=1 Tax=uncultured Selenomonas sp. TaxID=159275 RepID=UPI0028DCECDF